jgi:hypothetical protein
MRRLTVGTISSWVPGLVASPVQLGGGALGTSDGPFRNFDAEPGHDYQDVVGKREGARATFRGKAGRDVEFLFPIPTSPWVDYGSGGHRLSLNKVFVMHRADGGAHIDALYAYDGGKWMIWTPVDPVDAPALNLINGGIFDGSAEQFPPVGDPKLIEGKNMWKLFAPEPVFYGISVGVHVVFAAHNDDSTVSFASVGCDFVF